ncbi:MAG TPA: BrnA antitoxin family protein [Terriglobales bacterium]|nr:BrnA antitoxin family protein [Terriglobales bacterium]
MKNRNKNFDAELAALAQKRDEDIDTSDIPEVKDWSDAVVGKFYRPVKEAVSIRLDADILAWFKGKGCGYQTRINEVLRQFMASRRGRRIDAARGAAARGAPSGARCRSFQFPCLERHGQLQRSQAVAEVVAERHSLFCPTR